MPSPARPHPAAATGHALQPPPPPPGSRSSRRRSTKAPRTVGSPHPPGPGNLGRGDGEGGPEPESPWRLRAPHPGGRTRVGCPRSPRAALQGARAWDLPAVLGPPRPSTVTTPPLTGGGARGERNAASSPHPQRFPGPHGRIPAHCNAPSQAHIRETHRLRGSFHPRRWIPNGPCIPSGHCGALWLSSHTFPRPPVRTPSWRGLSGSGPTPFGNGPR